MRVLLIDVNYGASSTGKIVEDLHRYLNSHGHVAMACYGRGADRTDDDGRVYKFGLDWETLAHAGLTRLTGYTGRFSPLSTRRLLRAIDEFDPDVIHIHELHAYFVSLAPLLRHIAERCTPVVWTFHCEFMYTGKCGYAYECEGWTRSCGDCPRLRDYVSTLWFDRTSRMLEEKRDLLDALDLRIVCPSEWLAGRVRRSFLAGRDISVIHNGVDTKIFRPRDPGSLRRELGIGDGERVVLAVAPNLMDERKGGRSFVELARMNEGERTRFVMVGVTEGTEPVDAGGNVIVKGPIYDKELLAVYYSMADVFVICSAKETFSMTCAEAVSCGTRIVGFKSGAPETVFGREFAEFVDYGDLVGLNREIHECFGADAQIVDSMAFSSDQMCIAYLNRYEDCCAGRKAVV